MKQQSLKHYSRRELLELLVAQSRELEQELQRVQYNRRFRTVLKSTVYTLVTVAAVAVLAVTLWLPVLQIYGASMTPTLEPRDIVLTIRRAEPERGDIVAFYYSNKILVKRVIAFSGDWVDIDETGQVFVDGKQLREPYVSELDLGDTDIELPYQVPDGKLFVMGDHRATSLDSRNTAVGCVSDEQIVGRIIFRLWPLDRMGKIA